jgi:hypothetical protein
MSDANPETYEQQGLQAGVGFKTTGAEADVPVVETKLDVLSFMKCRVRVLDSSFSGAVDRGAQEKPRP